MEDFDLKLLHKLDISEKYLPKKELKFNHLYYILGRKSHLGIWIPKKKGFIISRFKFDRNYLFLEYHWDIGIPYGTVKPFIEIEEVPFDNIEIQNLSKDKFLRMDKSNKKLYKQLLKYLNKKSKEYPFMWIKDKIEF